MEVNRVIEVDMDTKRSNVTQVRIVCSTPNRQESIPCEPNTKMDLAVLTNGLLACILKAEQDGTYKRGEAVRKVIQNLEDGYIDVNNQVVETKNN